MFEKIGRFAAGVTRHPRKSIKAVAVLFFVLIIGGLTFTGCQNKENSAGKLENLEFTVVGERDTPEALQEMIRQKRENPFKLTYADGQDMYIVIGKGAQNGGGFSIAVRELYRTENSIVIKTELIGPEKGEETGSEKTYPVLIVKTGFYEEPVVFQ